MMEIKVLRCNLINYILFLKKSLIKFLNQLFFTTITINKTVKYKFDLRLKNIAEDLFRLLRQSTTILVNVIRYKSSSL